MEKLSRLLSLALPLMLLALAAPDGLAAKKKKKNKEDERFGVIAGSVFQATGQSLRGATVTVTRNPEQPDPSTKKRKALKTTTDNRGEFAIRVPAGSMRYTVKVEAKGFQPVEKLVQVQWDQRVEQYFRLKPASK